MNNTSPETRLRKYIKLDNPDGIRAMHELIIKKEHQKSMEEFVK